MFLIVVLLVNYSGSAGELPPTPEGVCQDLGVSPKTPYFFSG